MRFDDLVRSERYFTATLLPLLLFHKRDSICGVQQFVKLVDDKATEYKKTDEQITEHETPARPRVGRETPAGYYPRVSGHSIISGRPEAS